MNPLVIVFLIIWALSGIGLVVFILMHSGKGTGVSDMLASSMHSSMGSSGIVEKNLTRITVVLAVIFVVCLLVFMIIYPKGMLG